MVETAVEKPASQRARVRGLSNDALIIELINTLNRLSRWLTPVHDRSLLEYSPRRGDPSVKDVLVRMRDVEARHYALMYAIATQTNPDLDREPRVDLNREQRATDRDAAPLVVMAGFRRVRESTTSLLRALPDTAWHRGGYSRTERDWTIRQLAEFLAEHDWVVLSEIDNVLAWSGAREEIAEVSAVRLDRIADVFVSSATSM